MSPCTWLLHPLVLFLPIVHSLSSPFVYDTNIPCPKPQTGFRREQLFPAYLHFILCLPIVSSPINYSYHNTNSVDATKVNLWTTRDLVFTKSFLFFFRDRWSLVVEGETLNAYFALNEGLSVHIGCTLWGFREGILS